MITEQNIIIMKKAIALSKNCPVSKTSYSVGAIITNSNNDIITYGYSRETADNVHAEEVAIQKALDLGIDLNGTTIYSTIEPCSLRLSGKKCCADRILESGISKVIFAINEPPYLVKNCTGAEKLKAHKIEVLQITSLDKEIIEINKHLK